MTNQTALVTIQPSKPGHFSAVVDIQHVQTVLVSWMLLLLVASASLYKALSDWLAAIG
jgi:hypothetical protein